MVMDDALVHYELFIRRRLDSPWTLDLANEDRTRMLVAAEEMLISGAAVAVRVTKETLDEESRQFRSVVVLSKGAVDGGKVLKARENREPLCVAPSDLYSGHARERIGRLLDGWLSRQRATPFELLHRPDLAEKLDASGTDLQHAIQKIAIPEAQERGLTVHELIRAFQLLVERTISRVLKDGRGRVFPDFSKEAFAEAANRLAKDRATGETEQSYLLGAGVAGAIARSVTWSEKVERLLDLADAAPIDGPGRALALAVLEQPLAEILGSKAGLSDLLGPDLDLGQQLCAMTRIASAETVEALIAVGRTVARMMPDLSGPAARLANWLDGPHFSAVRTALARRVLRELTGPRLLKPGDPEGEIATLRALAMALTHANGRVLAHEEVAEAFTTRSRMLVASAFVESLLGDHRAPREEAAALLRLAENVTGGANKRQACRWIAANVSALKFERDLRESGDSPAVRLATLAALQRGLNHAGLAPEDARPVKARLGDLGGLVEADCQLVAALMKSHATGGQKLTHLLKLAGGESAPLGPAADRARLEALKLARSPGLRREILTTPALLAGVRKLIEAVDEAA
jgi:hypothetical protein